MDSQPGRDYKTSPAAHIGKALCHAGQPTLGLLGRSCQLFRCGPSAAKAARWVQGGLLLPPSNARDSVIGHTDLCDPADTEDPVCAAGEGLFEFVLMATNRPMFGDHPAEKVVLQVEWRDGIAYRLSVCDILEETWEARGPQMKLIVLI